MFGEARGFSMQLRASLAGLDPALASGDDCASLAAELATTEKACAAARALLAFRAAETGAHRRLGFTDAADWLSRETGTSRPAAQAALDTAEALDDLPGTREAVVSGELSLHQAGEIAGAAAALDDAERAVLERELLHVARHATLRGLKDKARDRRLEREDPEALRGRQRKARYLRHWRDRDGMIRIEGAFAPEDGIPLVNRLDAETARCRRQAKREAKLTGAEVETWDKHAADALVGLTAGGGSGGARVVELVIVADIKGYRRGHTHPGEVCHIVGGGPIPVSLARELEKDAFLKVVLHDGVQIHTVKHFGRYRKAELRTALELGAPPEFAGVSCTGDDCDRRYGLEWDHVVPLAAGGETSFENIGPRCRPHHKDKSERERQAGLYSRPAKPARPADPPGEAAGPAPPGSAA